MEKGLTRKWLTFPSTAPQPDQILMGEDYLSLSQLPEPLSLWSADPWLLIGAALPLKVGLNLKFEHQDFQAVVWASGFSSCGLGIRIQMLWLGH